MFFKKKKAPPQKAAEPAKPIGGKNEKSRKHYRFWRR